MAANAIPPLHICGQAGFNPLHHGNCAACILEWQKENLPKMATRRGDPWKEAVIDYCAIAGITLTSEDPRRTVERLIQWHIEVALDPSVSKAARKLLNTQPTSIWQRLGKLFERREPEALYCEHGQSYYDKSGNERCIGCGELM
jgi:hypothetical protein